MESDPKAVIEIPAGLTPEQAHAIINAVCGALPPGTVPGQLSDSTAPPQVGERIGNALADVAASVPLSAESGWKSRKLWVALATLAGMLVQVPLEKRLTPQELIAVACVAVAYIVMQGLVDIAKVRANDQGPAA